MNRWMIVGVVCCSLAQAGHGIPDAPARFDGLLDYFQDANPAFFDHVRHLVEQQAAGQVHAGMTCVAGTSGVGKSYVIANLPFAEGTATKPIKLAQLFEQTKPDLQTLDGKGIFNRLPWAPSFDLTEVLANQQAQDKPFILLDDLDEIHPDTAMVVLQSVRDFIQDHAQTFVHVFVFGRPEAFGTWLTRHPRTPVHRLLGPDWCTTGDLAFCCHNYYGYKYSQPAPEEVVTTFQRHLEQYPCLRDTIRPLSGGNFVIKQSQTFKSKAQLQQALFQDLLTRNTESHGRPGPDDTRYITLLQQAVVFLQQHYRDQDEQGFFVVDPNDRVNFIDEQGACHAVRLMDLLNRSGLVNVDLTRLDQARYRFEPLWVQEYLSR